MLFVQGAAWCAWNGAALITLLMHGGDEVREFLTELGMVGYADNFRAVGFVSKAEMLMVTESDLVEDVKVRRRCRLNTTRQVYPAR